MAAICSVLLSLSLSWTDRMVGALVWRGMRLGVLAGLLCFGFLKLLREAPIERAIAFEAQHEKEELPGSAQAHASPGSAENEPQQPVSREMQTGLGLFVGVTVYAATFGGLFALAFALVYRRMADLSARATAAVLAPSGSSPCLLVAAKVPTQPARGRRTRCGPISA